MIHQLIDLINHRVTVQGQCFAFTGRLQYNDVHRFYQITVHDSELGSIAVDRAATPIVTLV